MKIRHATVDDAEELAHLILQVEKESVSLLFAAGERTLSPKQQRSQIEAMRNEENSTLLRSIQAYWIWNNCGNVMHQV